jgi:hypothetical protein
VCCLARQGLVDYGPCSRTWEEGVMAKNKKDKKKDKKKKDKKKGKK